jgi:glycolate oxidase
MAARREDLSRIEQSPELVALQRDLKRVFDPKDLLNPGKIFPARGHSSC